MKRKIPTLAAAGIVLLASCASDDFDDRAREPCEQSYQQVVGGPEWPDQSERGHAAFVRGCVEAEKQKRREAQERGDDYEP